MDGCVVIMTHRLISPRNCLCEIQWAGVNRNGLARVVASEAPVGLT
jgi:hypothetical protein